MIAEAEDEKSSAFSVSQEDIDAVLVKGNSVEHGKYRIYHQFQKQEDKKSNVEFLKKEYARVGSLLIFQTARRAMYGMRAKESPLTETVFLPTTTLF